MESITLLIRYLFPVMRVFHGIKPVSGFVFNYHFPVLNIFKCPLISSTQM